MTCSGGLPGEFIEGGGEPVLAEVVAKGAMPAVAKQTAHCRIASTSWEAMEGPALSGMAAG